MASKVECNVRAANNAMYELLLMPDELIISITNRRRCIICSVLRLTLTMFNLFITGCIITCIVLPIYGKQYQTTRYKDLVFKNIKIDNNIVYQPNPPEGAKKKYYLFDLYQPQNDTCTSRPLILWMHGGGFKFGNKKSRGTPLWSKRFAQRGYVCAAVNYRLSKKNTLSDLSALVNACSDAIEDINQAITFFKKNHLLYKIDTNRIILAGNSAGGMIALQYVYSNPALMQQTGQAGIEKTLPAFNPEHIKAVINFWGGMFNLEWLKNANVPIVSVYGSKDRIVPPADPGNGIYGSILIHQYADSLHIFNRVKIFDGYAHELQKRFNPFWAGKATHRRLEEAGQFAADFLYAELFK